MSDIAKSNDYNELQLFFPRVLNVLEERYKARQFNLTYKNYNGVKAFNRLLDDIYDITQLGIKTEALTSFVTCFSGARDKLSQWRGYANNARGGAIGFSVHELSSYAEKNSNEIKFVKVKYINEEDYANILNNSADNLLDLWKNKLSNTIEKFESVLEPELVEQLFLYLCHVELNRFMISSLRYKMEGFAEEEEYRLYTLESNIKFSDVAILSKIDNDEVKRFLSRSIVSEKLEFNVTEANIIPFYPILLKNISKAPIKEILLGPNNKISRSDFQLLLTNNEWDVNNIAVNRSGISYRI